MILSMHSNKKMPFKKVLQKSRNQRSTGPMPGRSRARVILERKIQPLMNRSNEGSYTMARSLTRMGWSGGMQNSESGARNSAKWPSSCCRLASSREACHV